VNTCLPKEFEGGVGIINTRVMNEAMLLKWVWRIYNNKEEQGCCALLKNI
jgi:hypothetical protein